MNGLYRILGAAAAVAVGGIAIAAINKLLDKDAPLYVESTEFPEQAETDPAVAAEVAQTYADAAQEEANKARENAGEAMADAQDALEEAHEAQEEARAAQEEADSLQAEADAAQAAADAPNPNPVDAAPAQAPKDAEGKFDATKIASPEDFANWEDMGCQG